VGQHIYAKFYSDGVRPAPIIFAWIVRSMNALQLCRWQFSHKKNFLQAKSDLTAKTAVLRFCVPFGGLGQRTMIILAHWKVRNELNIVNLTFFARCYAGATSECRLKIGDFPPTRSIDTKFQVEEVAPTNHSFSN